VRNSPGRDSNLQRVVLHISRKYTGLVSGLGWRCLVTVTARVYRWRQDEYRQSAPWTASGLRQSSRWQSIDLIAAAHPRDRGCGDSGFSCRRRRGRSVAGSVRRRTPARGGAVRTTARAIKLGRRSANGLVQRFRGAVPESRLRQHAAVGARAVRGTAAKSDTPGQQRRGGPSRVTRAGSVRED